MDNIQLLKCAQALTSKWKEHFGLYTQYVGYLTAEMVNSLVTVWRLADPNAFEGLPDTQITYAINSAIMDINDTFRYGLYIFPTTRDVDSVMPKLIAELCKWDLDEDEVPQEQWEQFISYLKSKETH